MARMDFEDVIALALAAAPGTDVQHETPFGPIRIRRDPACGLILTYPPAVEDWLSDPKRLARINATLAAEMAEHERLHGGE